MQTFIKPSGASSKFKVIKLIMSGTESWACHVARTAQMTSHLTPELYFFNVCHSEVFNTYINIQ